MSLSTSDDKKAEILNDHYKDTCLKLAGYRKQRNRLAFYAGVTIAITCLLELSPETRNAILSILFSKLGINTTNTTQNIDSLLTNHGLRILPGFILTFIAFTFKHYRIAIDKQYTYVQMLESELNSLYSRSNLFNRETNFSSNESSSFAMWSSEHYSRVLKWSCFCLVFLYMLTMTINDGFGLNVSIYGCIASLISFVFFASKKPLSLPTWITK